MILSDKTLMKMLDEHTLIVDPLEIGQIQPASIDIRIGNTYSIVEDSSSGIINLDDEISYKQITAEKYILLPGQFVPVSYTHLSLRSCPGMAPDSESLPSDGGFVPLYIRPDPSPGDSLPEMCIRDRSQAGPR